MSYLQATLAHHFRVFDRVAIVGGLVRDFAREGRSEFRSDVDLVIDAPAEDVAQLAKRLRATPNRFGGYGSKEGLWKIDFWALETTWARRHVPLERLEDIVFCTFFDCDAVAYNLWDRKLICADGYLERLAQKVLDINLRPNPSPMGNLIRAIRRLVLWQVLPGPKLKKFIQQHLDDDALRLVQKTERKLFSHHVSTSWRKSIEAQKFLLDQDRVRGTQFQFVFGPVLTASASDDFNAPLDDIRNNKRR